MVKWTIIREGGGSITIGCESGDLAEIQRHQDTAYEIYNDLDGVWIIRNPYSIEGLDDQHNLPRS